MGVERRSNNNRCQIEVIVLCNHCPYVRADSEQVGALFDVHLELLSDDVHVVVVVVGGLEQCGGADQAADSVQLAALYGLLTLQLLLRHLLLQLATSHLLHHPLHLPSPTANSFTDMSKMLKENSAYSVVW